MRIQEPKHGLLNVSSPDFAEARGEKHAVRLNLEQILEDGLNAAERLGNVELARHYAMLLLEAGTDATRRHSD